MYKADLSTPRRQNLLGLIVLLANSIRKIGWNILPLLIYALIKEDFYANNKLLIISAICVILILLVVHSILFYLNFLFSIENNDFVLRRGYINKKTIRIPLDKIQTVNTKQNLLQQILNVVSLEVDTAGSSVKEVSITALRRAEADIIKRALIEHKNENTDETDEKTTDKNNLIKLSPSDLIKIAFSENILKTGLLVMLTIYSVYSQYREYINRYFAREINDFENQLNTINYTAIAILLVLFIVLSIVATIIKTFIIYYDLSLIKTEKGFELKCGLLNRKNNIVPKHKIQLLKYSFNPIKKLFDIVSITMKQASPNDVKEKQSLKIPGCSNRINNSVIEYIFESYSNSHFTTHFTAKYYFIRNWIWLSFPVAIAIQFLPEISQYTLAFIGIFGWFIPCTIAIWLSSKKRNFSISDDIISIQSGSLGTTITLIELHKIQSVKYRQSVFQKRRKLASIKVVTASESISIPFIDQQIASDLYNYILYKIESSNKNWM